MVSSSCDGLLYIGSGARDPNLGMSCGSRGGQNWPLAVLKLIFHWLGRIEKCVGEMVAGEKCFDVIGCNMVGLPQGECLQKEVLERDWLLEQYGVT